MVRVLCPEFQKVMPQAALVTEGTNTATTDVEGLAPMSAIEQPFYVYTNNTQINNKQSTRHEGE